jgi:acetoin utilization protein AcuC
VAPVTCTLHVAWDERLTDYHFGPGHPLAPVRVELTMRLADEFGPLLRAFRPQILVSQHGADSHRLDPLAFSR